MEDRNGSIVYQKNVEMIERGITNFGSIFFIVYHLPESNGLEQFFNSVKITLWRMALAPQYVWWIGEDGCCNLALTIYGGYGRKDVADIDSIVRRLWHGDYHITLLHWQWLDGTNAQYLLHDLRSLIRSEPGRTLPHHRRSFGGTLR